MILIKLPKLWLLEGGAGMLAWGIFLRLYFCHADPGLIYMIKVLKINEKMLTELLDNVVIRDIFCL